MFRGCCIATVLCVYIFCITAKYLSKTDLDGSIFLGENPVFMSVQVMVGITTTWMDPDGYKEGRNMELSKSVLER